MDLFIKSISLKDEIKPSLFDKYPLNISALNFFVSLTFTSPVTIFNGENGTGKSTIIEAIVDSFGISIKGGNRNLSIAIDDNKEQHSLLSQYLLVGRGTKKPYRVFFFRAESFHELAYSLDKNEDINKSNYFTKELLKQSHGQSFMDLIEHQFVDNSLYIMDEPESALSPRNQLKLVNLIKRFSNKGCQFLLATHSPIILSCLNASIINVDNGMKNIKLKETEIFKIYKKCLENPEELQNDEFDI